MRNPVPLRHRFARRSHAPLGALLLAGALLAQSAENPVKNESRQEPVKQNRLANQNSPYLRQHATNPVDWYPWGEEALARAKKEDKPIFLSIGYAACHWCHVMEHESFEDPAVAAVMNANFVCIKVDREERPDLDEIYMTAVQAMGIGGGWPLSVWLTPDGRPFYGGTYFPPKDQHGRPGFVRVLEHLAKAWREQRSELDKGAAELSAHVQQALAPELPPGEPTAATLHRLVAQAKERFDDDYGGFSGPPTYAPKFPHAAELRALLRVDDAAARSMVEKTLTHMRDGGMYDQLGGGFHRYSTDRAWLVPHFEKMIYDNALLVPCYLEAGRPDVARETLDYMLREMRDPRGGFWSSQDADSEGVEGRFFVWDKAEFDRVVGDDAERAARHYGVTAAGNWEGTNVLVRADAEDGEWLQHARYSLFAARQQRVHPATDDKVLCGWNGLAITACAEGYRWLGDDNYLRAAQRAAAFALEALVTGDRCARSWHSGTAQHAGVLEDYSMLASGLIALFEADGDPRWLAAARRLGAVIVDRFGAPDGGFWSTADDHESLLARTKTPTEGSTPSGAALAVHALLRLGLLLGDEALYERGLQGLRYAHGVVAQSPAAVPSFVLEVQFHLADPREVVIAGAPADPRTQALLQAAWRSRPGNHVIALVHDENRKELEALSSVFAGKVPLDGVPAAYVCRRGVCQRPVTEPAQLAAVLGAR